MKISDIIALSRAGYKKIDIEKILKDEENEAGQIEQSEAQTDSAENIADEQPEAQTDGAESEVDETDYKKLYEESQKLLEETKKTLKDAQRRNTQTTVSIPPQQSDEDIFNDVVRSFM